MLVNIINENYILPTNNYQGGHFPAADKVSGETLAKTILKKPKGCFACTVQCGRATALNGVDAEGPEYETAWSLGPDCGVDDLAAVKKANDLCNDLGLDTIGAGATIACAMEMSQRGYIQDTIRFGDAAAVVELVRKMGYREGIGDELADGSYRFAEIRPPRTVHERKETGPARLRSPGAAGPRARLRDLPSAAGTTFTAT